MAGIGQMLKDANKSLNGPDVKLEVAVKLGSEETKLKPAECHAVVIQARDSLTNPDVTSPPKDKILRAINYFRENPGELHAERNVLRAIRYINGHTEDKDMRDATFNALISLENTAKKPKGDAFGHFKTKSA